jgi:hypothetical protein
MQFPEWTKPALLGAAAGAIALSIVGFGWGGWKTGGAAEQMASNMARGEVIAALAPICVEQSKMDPRVTQTMMQIKEANSYKRRDMVMEAGWATMPGASEADRFVATACLERLQENF